MMKTKLFLLGIAFVTFFNSSYSQRRFKAEEVVALTMVTTGSRLYVGTNAGLFYSEDEGKTWNFTGPDNYISSLDANESIIVAGTDYSLDRGITWDEIYGAKASGKIKVSGTDIFMLGYPLYYSDNGKFVEEVKTLGIPMVMDLQGNTIYLATKDYYSTKGGVFSSTDKGKTWNLFKSLSRRTEFTCIAASGDKIFLGGNKILLASTDKGVSFKKAEDGLPKNYIITNIFIDGKNIYATTPQGIFYSENDGQAWTSTNNEVTNSYQTLAFCTQNDFLIINGKLYAAPRNTRQWKSINDDFRNAVAAGTERRFEIAKEAQKKREAKAELALKKQSKKQSKDEIINFMSQADDNFASLKGKMIYQDNEKEKYYQGKNPPVDYILTSIQQEGTEYAVLNLFYLKDFLKDGFKEVLKEKIAGGKLIKNESPANNTIRIVVKDINGNHVMEMPDSSGKSGILFYSKTWGNGTGVAAPLVNNFNMGKYRDAIDKQAAANAQRTKPSSSRNWKLVGENKGVLLYAAANGNNVVFEAINLNTYSVSIPIRIAYECEEKGLGSVGYVPQEVTWTITLTPDSRKSYDDPKYEAACGAPGCREKTSKWAIKSWSVEQ